MCSIIIATITLVFAVASLYAIYRNKLLSQVNCEMTNSYINSNDTTFAPRDIVSEIIAMRQ